jgi:general transcription factor 3C polypeptide 5 (transcription factor C subunit 1)
MKLARMAPEELESEHTFDGFNVSQTGNLFQFCDITDPLIAKILATKDIRATCAPTFQGWYHVGTWAKATVILKDKMNTIIGGDKPDDSIYQRIVTWPELWDDREMAAQYKSEIDDRRLHHEKRREHQVMHNVRWAARNPRYAFEKMEALDEQERQADKERDLEEEEPDDVDVPEDMTEDPVQPDTILNADIGEAEDEGDDQDGEGDEDDEMQIEDRDEGAYDSSEVDDDDDDSDSPVASVRATSEGPVPFGGYYKV